MQILVNGNSYQAQHLDQLYDFLLTLSRAPGIRLAVEPDFHSYLSAALPCVASRLSVRPDGFVPDLMLSIGGDGTFLATAALAGDSGIPVMGINSGHLGYLAAAQLSDTESIISSILNHTFIISPRSLIEVTDDQGSKPQYALNEVAFLKKDSSSMIAVHASLTTPASSDDRPAVSMPLAEYLGDGLIVATPTGSTGYNLSVGGPIVAPSAPNFIVSPVAPHSLTMRSLVLPDTVSIDISTSTRAGQFLVSVDGRSTTHTPSTHFRLRKAPFTLNLVHLPDHTFIETLRTKLLWGVDGR